MSLIEELKRDLVDPIKTFTEEVCDDTIGDAERFYSAHAKKLRRTIRLTEERTKEKTAAIRREQEERKRRRQAKLSRAVIVFAGLAVLILIVVSLALNRGV